MSDNASMWETLNCLPDAVEHMIHGDPDEPDSVKASDAVRWAIAEIVKLREDRRWVPVGERLPGDGHIVFATDGSHVDQLRYFAGFGFECLGGDDPLCVVTHWMPLPPGPETKELGSE